MAFQPVVVIQTPGSTWTRRDTDRKILGPLCEGTREDFTCISGEVSIGVLGEIHQLEKGLEVRHAFSRNIQNGGGENFRPTINSA